MPTGYTAPIHDGEPITFEQFVWRCARAFGALLPMRDEPMDAPIPEEFVPYTNYHEKHIAAAEDQIARLTRMIEAEVAEAARAAHAAAVEAVNASNAKTAARIARYRAMLDQVEVWEPPTPDHAGLRDFMSEQLSTSIAHDDYRVPAPETRTPEEWRQEQLKIAERDLDYHRRELLKEIGRTEKRNRWVQDLRGALETIR